MNFPISIPPQSKRHIPHIFFGGCFFAGGALLKKNLEESWLKDNIKDDGNRKALAYAYTVVGAMFLGGTLKCIRTRTFNGTIAGIVSSGTLAFLGALVQDFQKTIRNNS